MIKFVTMKTKEQKDTIHNDELVKFYEETQRFYSKESMSMHSGIWDEDTETLTEANLNTNLKVAEALELKNTDYALDTGCGIGGTAIHLAKKIKCKIVGLTLLQAQVDNANAYSKEVGVSNQTEFIVGDYLKVPFNNNTFDKVYGIETVCHTKEKKDYIQEAYRVLKPGGKLAVLDAYVVIDDMSKKEKSIYNQFLEDFLLPNLEKESVFLEKMSEVGFKNVEFIDYTTMVQKSTKKYYKITSLVYPFFLLLNILKLIPKSWVMQMRAVKYTHLLVGDKLERNICSYGIAVGTK